MKKLNIIFLIILLSKQNTIKSEWNSSLNICILIGLVMACAGYNIGVSHTKNQAQVLLNCLFDSIQSDNNITQINTLEKICETTIKVDKI